MNGREREKQQACARARQREGEAETTEKKTGCKTNNKQILYNDTREILHAPYCAMP